MNGSHSSYRFSRLIAARASALFAFSLAASLNASAQTPGNTPAPVFTPGNLVISRSLYSAPPSAVTLGQTLPPGCTSGCGKAVSDGNFPYVFNPSSSMR
jgi:hypothetical protein